MAAPVFTEFPDRLCTSEMGKLSVNHRTITLTNTTETDLMEFDTAEQGGRTIAFQVAAPSANLVVKYYVSFDRINWTAIATVNMAGSAKATNSGVTITSGNRDTFVLDYANDVGHAAVRYHKITGTNADTTSNAIDVYGSVK